MATARNRWTPYATALLAVVLATVARWLLGPLLGAELPLITYLVAVILLARMVSAGPAVAAALFGAVAGTVLFTQSTALDPYEPAYDLARYLIICAAAIGICELMRRSDARADAQAAILAAATESALDCIVTIDADDRIVEFNRSAERTFGHRREDAIGRDMADLLIPEPMRARHRQGLALHLATGNSNILGKRIELSALKADGSEFPVELTVTRVDLAGRTLFTAFLRDLTERRVAQAALAESERRFRHLIEQITDYAIFTLDLDRRTTSWNEGVKRVLGFDEEEFLGKDVTARIFTPEDVASGVPEREFQTAARSGAASDDRWMRRKDGTRFFAAGVTISHLDEAGRMVGYAKIMRDQTTRKEMENRMRHTAADLAQAVEKQSRFLAMLSHELRNPMAALRNAVEILSMKRQGGIDDPMVDLVGRQVVHMGRLIDDLLDASRIRSGRIQLHRERVDLVASVRQAAEVVTGQCTELQQELSLDLPAEPLWLDADPTRVVQVLGNLLHNACKFTSPGGRVTVTVRRDAELAEVRVADTGIGIAADHLEGIFEMFLQIDESLGRAQGGLGIGLSVVKSLVEMHGGTIEARSDGPGRGSEFIVRLPLAPALSEAAAKPPPGRELAPQRILVLDDNHDAAESLKLVLELHGHEAISAHDGVEALAAVEREHPRIGLLDLGLPGMSGYEVAQRIRAGDQGADMVLVAVTGWGQEDDRRRTREAGFDAHMTKPVEYGALAAVLAELVEKPRATGT